MKKQSVLLISIIFIFIFGPYNTNQILANNDNFSETDEQIKIKFVINSYFEWRYQAMSSLQLTSIDKFVFDSKAGASFANSEMGKLHLEIEHAKLNQLWYTEYQYFLDYKEISINSTSQTAIINLTEDHDVVFKISQEISNLQNPISSMHNLNHLIIMGKESGEWKIVSDTYEDYLWRLLRTTGISSETLLQSMQTRYLQPAKEADNLNSACALPEDSSTHSYNRNGALAYAQLWATAASPYNYPKYYDFTNDGGDCTNFVSQAIHEGGNADMIFGDTPGVGVPGWYYKNIYDRAAAWNDVTALYNFITNYWAFPSGPEGCAVSQNDVYEGDLIQYDWTNDGFWDHSVIIVNTIWIGYTYYHYVAGHTSDVYNYPFTSFDYPYKVYRFIHIERIDGFARVHLPVVLNGFGGTANLMQTPNPSLGSYPPPGDYTSSELQLSPYPAP